MDDFDIDDFNIDDLGTGDGFDDFDLDLLDTLDGEHSNDYGSGYEIEGDGVESDSDIISQDRNQTIWELLVEDDRSKTETSPMMGMASLTSLKQGQLSHQSIAVQKAVKDAIEGNLNGVYANKDKLEIDLAVSKAGQAIGGDPSQLLSGLNIRKEHLPSNVSRVKRGLLESYQIKERIKASGPITGGHQARPSSFRRDTKVYPSKDLYGANQNTPDALPVRYEDRSYMPPASQETVHRAMGFLERSEEYTGAGPGSKLPGHVLSIEGQDPLSVERSLVTQERLDGDMMKAVGIVSDIAELYIHDLTKGTSVYASRKKAVEESLTKRFMDGTFYDGARSIMPLPNETGITGIKPTMSYGGTTTPYTRVQFAGVKDEFEEGSKEFFQYLPNLAGSLFTKKDGYDKAAQNKNLDKTIELAGFARDVFREQLPTVRDESSGQIRMAGYDMAYGKQEANTGFWDEAAQLDLTMDSFVEMVAGGGNSDITGSGGGGGTGQTMPTALGTSRPVFQGFADGPPSAAAMLGAQENFARSTKAYEGSVELSNIQFVPKDTENRFLPSGEVNKEYNPGKGSDTAGMYGEKGLSEHRLYVEARESGMNQEDAYGFARSEPGLVIGDDVVDPGVYRPNMSDQEKYIMSQIQNPSPRQGTKAWLDQRKGNITASGAAKLLTKFGSEKVAIGMSEEALGYKAKQRGNAHMVEGNQGESLALQAFLRGPGKGMVAEEAFFETNSLYKGMGASPDARLFDEDGKSQGLLELKYLSSTTMAGALKSYTPQMQMQMLIAEEEQTHFLALDKYTGDIVSEIVYADKDMQADLLSAAIVAQELHGSASDRQGVVDLRNRIKSKVSAKSKSGAQSGSEAKWSPPNKAKEEKMTVFQPADSVGMSHHELYDRADANVRNTRLMSRDGDMMSEMFKIRQEETRVSDAKKKALSHMPVASGQGQEDSYLPPMEERVEATEEKIEAEGKATDSADSLSESLKKAASDLGAFSGAIQTAMKVILEGNESAMDEVRFAAETGMDVNGVRGARKALEKGGLTTESSSSVLTTAGRQQALFNNAGDAATEFTRQQLARGKSNLAEVRNLNIPLIDAQSAMNPQERTSMVAEMLEGKSPEARAYIANEIFGMGELSSFDSSRGGSILAQGDVDQVGARDSYEGIVAIAQVERETIEAAGSIRGEAGRNASAAARSAQSLRNYVPFGSNKAVQAGVGAFGVGLAAGGAMFDGREDGGSPIIPMAATPSRWADQQDDFLNGPMPSDKIINTTTNTSSTTTPVVNNIEVVNNISKDSTSTEVSENGDQIYMDSSNGVGY